MGIPIPDAQTVRDGCNRFLPILRTMASLTFTTKDDAAVQFLDALVNTPGELEALLGVLRQRGVIQ